VARLHEHQGKALLAQAGVDTPRGVVIRCAGDAPGAVREVGGAAVLKIQAWTTGRKAMGGVVFVDTPDEAEAAAERLLSMSVGRFPVEEVLVEERVPIEHELFVSLSIDDTARAPVLLLAGSGGSGIEARAEEVARLPVDPETGVEPAELESALAGAPVQSPQREPVARAIDAAVGLARRVEARSLEINPLVTTTDGRVIAADCRMTIDDYAVFRHPELGIEIARELDHPPTELERAAYAIEQADHRGTFYFARLPVEPGDRVIGFHGAGGGGSMMSMDAVSRAGFTPANFTDTSGNPSPAKVYAAARIILAQEGLLGYFGSGSGVASQEQYHSAYGLAKAFLELGLTVPALIRLGGNSEDRACEILESACADLPATVEGYKKDHSPAFVADRFAALVEHAAGAEWSPRPRAVPGYVGSGGALSFPVRFGVNWEGRCWVDRGAVDDGLFAVIDESAPGVFRLGSAGIELALSEEEALARDSDLIAAEIECARAGRPAVFVDIPIPGLDDAPAEAPR